MAEGLGDDSVGHWFVASIAVASNMASDKTAKPPYRVPSMEEIVAAGDSGLTVASTFAGCGGSSTGYRMAGFRVLYANEFDEHAQQCYALNKAEYTVLDGRDIHEVTGADVMDACGLAAGELDVLDGSPPCQTFSTAGRRRMDDPRSTLFYEYARLVRELRPKVFVAENVSGMVKGVAKGYFKWILAELRACGYIVKVRLLDAQWLGVPQRRQRIIFVGVRNDLAAEPAFPSPLPYNYSIRNILPGITAIEEGDGFNADQNGHRLVVSNSPCPVILSDRCVRKQTPGVAVRRKLTIAELSRICGYPDDFKLTGSYAKQWARLGNSVPPVMMWRIAATIRRSIFGVKHSGIPLPEDA
jgi:DNA (cytosine-5)-methyltransferase 1